MDSCQLSTKYLIIISYNLYKYYVLLIDAIYGIVELCLSSVSNTHVVTKRHSRDYPFLWVCHCSITAVWQVHCFQYDKIKIRSYSILGYVQTLQSFYNIILKFFINTISNSKLSRSITRIYTLYHGTLQYLVFIILFYVVSRQ